jgi:hypothetical protein
VKKWSRLRRGRSSACGQSGNGTPPFPESLRLDSIQALRLLEARGSSGAGQGAGSGTAQGLGARSRAGPRAATGRPAGGEGKQRRSRAGGLTEKEGITEERTRMTEKRRND